MTADVWLRALLYLISTEITGRPELHSPFSFISSPITYWDIVLSKVTCLTSVPAQAPGNL